MPAASNSVTSPTLMPATGAFSGTPASSRARVPPQTEAIEVDPLDSIISEETRMAYPNSEPGGMTGSRERSARAPCPISRRL